MVDRHPSPSASTRDQIIAAAHALFVERGFHGVSLANIGDSLNLTKQALIHHFGTKERLYGSVLEQMSDRCVAAVEPDSQASPEAMLDSLLDRFCAYALAHPGDMVLICRELLDNRAGAAEVGNWALAPLLRRLVVIIQATGKWRDAPEPQALALACQLLGAVSLFAISEPALSRIFGHGQLDETTDIFPGEFRRTVRRLFRD